MAKKDLVPMNLRTEEEQKKIASKGGKASGEARRRKRTMKSAAQLILSLPVKDQNTIKALLNAGVDNPEGLNNLEAMVAVAVAKAKSGDLKALSFIRDTIGESPQWSAYRERTETMQQAHDTVTALVDDWINSIPE